MTRFLLAAGVAALAIAAPAAADPGKNAGKGGDRAERVKSVQKERAERRIERRADRRVERRAERRSERGSMRVARFERDRDDDKRRVVKVRGGDDDKRRVAKVRGGDNDNRRVVKVRDRDDDDRRIVRLRDRDDDRRTWRARDRDDDRRGVVRFRDRDDDRRFARVRDFDDDERWMVPGRGRALIDGCPPGLAKQNELCMPPGQYRKRVLGQILPAAYRQHVLPKSLRALYQDTDDHYWRYGDNGYLYKVDRDTNLVNALLPLIGGGFAVGQLFPTTYMNSYVPNYYQPFYPDTSDDYYRYANGYVYEIDRDTGLIEDMIPLYDRGYGIGQMLPASYSYYNVPMQYRSWYQDDDDYYYRYAPGAIYQVDRGSNLITAIMSLLTGGFGVGQQLPMGYDTYNVPLAYRGQYYDTADSWYRYNNGYIYQVDPTTRLITAVIQAIT